MSSLELGDPLAHRALQALVRAEATVRRRLAAELERAGVSAAGFSALVVLTTAGGALELRTLRRRFDWSKANATEVTETLEARGSSSAAGCRRTGAPWRCCSRRPAARSWSGSSPQHAERVSQAFDALDDGEKRSLAEICRKLRPVAVSDPPEVGHPDRGRPELKRPREFPTPDPAPLVSTGSRPGGRASPSTARTV